MQDENGKYRLLPVATQRNRARRTGMSVTDSAGARGGYSTTMG
jgi:hypothetical protein